MTNNYPVASRSIRDLELDLFRKNKQIDELKKLKNGTLSAKNNLIETRMEQLKKYNLLSRLAIRYKKLLEQDCLEKSVILSKFTTVYDKLYPKPKKLLIDYLLINPKLSADLEIIKLQNKKLYEAINRKIRLASHRDGNIFQVQYNLENYDIYRERIFNKLVKYTHNLKIEKLIVQPFKVKKIIDTVLQNIESHHKTRTSWRTIIEKRTTFAVNQNTKTIHIPNKKQNRDKLLGLIYHEILTHVLRGEQSLQYNLLNPLPNYRIFEEGLGKTLELLFTKKNTHITSLNYTQPLIVGLSHCGVSWTEIESFITITNPKNATRHLQRAYKKTIYYRFGVPNSYINRLHMKDISYSLGVHLVYRLVYTHKYTNNKDIHRVLEEIWKILFICKFDPTNWDHIIYLVEEGILKIENKSLNEYKKFLDTDYIKSVRELLPVLL